MTIEDTKKRLSAIEEQLVDLKGKQSQLMAKWSIEKNSIAKIRSIKSQIDELKTAAERYEREGMLEKVAEIRYGRIHQLEADLQLANDKLQDLQEGSKLLNEEVNSEDIAHIVAKATGIPVSKMMETERSKLVTMEDKLKDRVVGQDHAAIAISNAIRRSRAGMQDENRPIGSFVFLGTTGVGKTEMAKSLASFLFDDEKAMVRIDMSEYSEKFAVSRLIGAPPGYVGYDQGGQLTDTVRQRPYAVILLDEIEKAHPEIFNILLQVLDDGRLTDSRGRTVDFTNTIIIMTSNIGTDIIQKRMTEITHENKSVIMGEIKDQVMGQVKGFMRPEFLNRIDEIILFNPLDEVQIQSIASIQLQRLEARILKNNEIELELSNEALEWLSKIGYDPTYGARPLKRAIQKHIIDELSMKFLSGDIAKGDKVKVHADENGSFTFTTLKSNESI
jgi:ATP-dependent Clp protease ATP-binding subunit ClpB